MNSGEGFAGLREFLLNINVELSLTLFKGLHQHFGEINLVAV